MKKIQYKKLEPGFLFVRRVFSTKPYDFKICKRIPQFVNLFTYRQLNFCSHALFKAFKCFNIYKLYIYIFTQKNYIHCKKY